MFIAGDARLALGPGEGESIGVTVVKIEGPELTVLEIAIPPGGEIAPHRHRAQSDSFYVLDGELEFVLGDRVVCVTTGSWVHAPAGVVHGFHNTGERSARMLNVHVPGGFAAYIRETAALRASGVEPDTAFFERHDVFDP